MDGMTLSKIAHELRTPLTLINSTLQMIEAQLPQMKELKYWIQLNEDFRDMNDLVTKLTAEPTEQNFDKEIEQREEIDLYRMLQNLQDSFLLNPLGKGAFLSLAATAEAREVASHFSCARIPIKQVFTNLIKNALEATESQAKRRIQVSLSITHIPLSNEKPDLHFLCTSVCDNGPGIPQEILPHLYTPFVSGKKNGVGIGLSVVENIVHNHHGYLEVESNSSGTSFFVYLPYIL